MATEARIEVAITIDDVTHMLAWSPDGRVSLFRRERGELSTCGTGTWDGAHADVRPAGVREEVCEALEAALRLALRARRRGSQPAQEEVAEAPAPRAAGGDDAPPSSIDVVYEDEGTVYFRRIVGPAP